MDYHLKPEPQPDVTASQTLLSMLHAGRFNYNKSTSTCKICNGTSHIFDTIDMGRSCHKDVFPLGILGLSIIYRKCEYCSFLFTTDFDDFTPSDWTKYIYNDDYVKVDPDYEIVRPLLGCGFIESQFSKRDTVGLDYGAGNGLMAATLRNHGWVYDAYDPYGTNSVHKDRIGSYNLCSAFEVVEHMPDPVAGFKTILEMCSSDKLMIVIGTSTSDGMISNTGPLSWWYAGPRNGHISLFSKDALRRLAARFGLTYTSFGSSTHYLTRHWTAVEIATMMFRGKARRMLTKRLNAGPVAV